MKKRFVVLIILIAFITAMPAFSAGGAFKDYHERLKSADFSVKRKVLDLLHNKYPDLGFEAGRYVVKNYPEMPVKIVAARSEFIARKYPGLQFKLPRIVLEEVTKKRPTILLDMAIDFSKLIFNKYPTLPSNMMKWKARQHMRSKTIAMLQKKHPTLKMDMMQVLLQGRYPGRLKAAKADVMDMMEKKHPELKMKIGRVAGEIINEKYPELPVKIARIKENLNKNPRFAVVELICNDYPQLAPEILTAVRDKHGKEVHEAIIDVLYVLETNHGTLASDLKRDMCQMLEQKHPTLIADVMEIRISSKQAIAKKVRAKYPGLYKDVMTLVEKKYVGLGKEVRQIVEANFPNLRKEMAKVMDSKFSGFTKAVEQEVKRRYPHLTGHLDNILQ